MFKNGRWLVHGNSRKECYFLRVGFISTRILRYFLLSSNSFIQVLMRAYIKHYKGSDQSSIGWKCRNKYKTIFAIVMCARDIRRNVPAQSVFSNLCRFPLRCGLISQWISWMGYPLQWVNQPFLWLWIGFPSTPILFPFLIHTKEFFSHVF